MNLLSLKDNPPQDYDYIIVYRWDEQDNDWEHWTGWYRESQPNPDSPYTSITATLERDPKGVYLWTNRCDVSLATFTHWIPFPIPLPLETVTTLDGKTTTIGGL